MFSEISSFHADKTDADICTDFQGKFRNILKYNSFPMSLLLICIFPCMSNLNLVLLVMPIKKPLSLKLSEYRTGLQSKNKPMQIQSLCDLNNKGDVSPMK